ncbi:P-loop containing nucleoside triphosphate hydrolase protein [Hysterangium stoloniferum]|nr:P-loop containing nucleoside triphosphate hydrolase protein [Hysterangium stoloniferum]
MLWSVPRSTSTAFERAFIERKDTEVLHEPFSEPFYYGPERLSGRYTEAQCSASDAKDVTFSDTLQLILQTQASSDGKLIVVKDMAYYVVRPDKLHTSTSQINPTVFSDAELKKFRHTFLIRTPAKTLPSYYRATISNCHDFGEFDPSEAGFVELQALMAYTKHLLPKDRLILLDSADLIADPERALRAFCTGVGIEFEDTMLSWEAKHVSIFDKWKGWHDNAQSSTGFKEVRHEEIHLPEIVKNAVDNNMLIYEDLQEYKLRI